MTNKNINKVERFNRRKFLNIAGLAATAGLVPIPSFAEKNNSETFIDQDRSSEIQFPEIKNKAATIIETKTICVEPGKMLGQGTEYGLNINGHQIVTKRVLEPNRYLGWPTVLKTNKGQLMVAFSGDRDAHVCPFGKTQVITSENNGETWSEPTVINNTPLDDRDAGLIQTKKGTLLVSWFTSLVFEKPTVEATYNKYGRIGEKIGPENKKKWLGNWTRRSEDEGKTWLEPVKTVVTAPHGPVNLKNGDLMYIGTGVYDGKAGVFAEKSTDDGKTWKVIGTLPKPEGSTAGISEPHVIELKSGKLLALIRHEPKDTSKCFLLQSESVDGGKTWTEMKATPIWGYPPHLTQLKNGWLLVVYGVRKEPFSERACISKDEGKTWDIANEVTLANAASKDLGYPSSVQLDDNSILTVFYQAPKFGEPTVLMSTHWKLS